MLRIMDEFGDYIIYNPQYNFSPVSYSRLLVDWCFKLTQSKRTVFSTLYLLTNSGKRGVAIKITELQEETDLSQPAIYMALKWLIGSQWIIKKKLRTRTGERNVYFLNKEKLREVDNG